MSTKTYKFHGKLKNCLQDLMARNCRHCRPWHFNGSFQQGGTFGQQTQFWWHFTAYFRSGHKTVNLGKSKKGAENCHLAAVFIHKKVKVKLPRATVFVVQKAASPKNMVEFWSPLVPSDAVYPCHTTTCNVARRHATPLPFIRPIILGGGGWWW